jgi:hypothetical protein
LKNPSGKRKKPEQGKRKRRKRNELRSDEL